MNGVNGGKRTIEGIASPLAGINNELRLYRQKLYKQMKVSKLLSSVLFEPWMMLPEAAELHLPMIAAWLLGNEIQFEEKGRLDIQMAFAGRISPGFPEDVADMPDGSVAIVNLKGELTKYDGMCSYGAVTTGNLIKTLGASKNISGVVIDFDGPGGSVNAISPIIESIQFVQRQGKPIVGHADLIASAHLYAGVYTDHLMMDNTISSHIGSIGVMTTLMDYREKLKQMGVDMKNIYATQSTHKNLESEQALEGDFTLLKKNVLDPLAAKFQQAVREQRGAKLNEKVDGILNGAMFFAEDAVKNGLADSIGTLEDSIQRVLDLVEVRKFMKR